MEYIKKEFKMIKIVLISMSILFINSCKGQISDTKITNNSKKDTMEYFNENKYKGWELQKGSNSQDKVFMKDDEQVRIIQSETAYVEDQENIKQFMVNRRAYSLKSKRLIYITKRFYNFPIGITKEYDENGKLINEIDNDQDYKITTEQLCTIIKKEFNVDISIRPDIKKNLRYGLYRGKKETYSNDYRYIYEVIFYVDTDEGGSARKIVTIDGNTGEILYIEEQNMDKGGNYLPHSKTPFPQKGEKKKSSSIYKTHNGVNYTQSEWEAYEEKQYEEYCKRTGRPYTPRDLKNPNAPEEPKNSFLAQDGETGDDNTPKKKGFWG